MAEPLPIRLVCTIGSDRLLLAHVDPRQEERIAEEVAWHVSECGEEHREHIVAVDPGGFVIPGGPAAWKQFEGEQLLAPLSEQPMWQPLRPEPWLTINRISS